MYPRKLKTVTVFYYQCYDSEGKRTNGHSTGQKTRTAAKAYCMKLYREGKLIPDKRTMTLGEFAKGWWDTKTCKYLEWRQLQNPLAFSTIDHYKTNLEAHIKPYFGSMRLNTISAEHIRNWILENSKNGYTNASINIQIATLRIMLKEAVRRNIIAYNPAEKIRKLKVENSEVQILKIAEVQKLFLENWQSVWDSREAYLFNKLAACTGMRSGELLGLKGSRVFADHIHVCVQYSRKYGLTVLKTKDSRNIPITGTIRAELETLIEKNGQGFIFSTNGGGVPVSRNKIYAETRRALEKIGIDGDEQRKRGIALHHWRHFLNTALLMANVNTLKVQQITGHKSLAMTRHYTHFDTREFTEILDVQNNLLAPDKQPRQTNAP